MARFRGLIAFSFGLLFMLGAGWFAFPRVLYERREQPLQFSHKVHAEKASMQCEDCHSFREDGTFAGIPAVEQCAACHSEPLGESPNEKLFVEKYAKGNREVPWLVYSRQPDNARFPHGPHVKLAKLACERCHGDHGKSDNLRVHQRNRISGYSRDIWGHSISGISLSKSTGLPPPMKMDDCTRCHAQHNLRHGCLDCHK